MATFATQALPLQVVPRAQEAVVVAVSSTTFPSCKLNTVEGFATHTWNPGTDSLATVERAIPVFPSTSFGLVAFDVVHVAFTVQVLAPLAMVQLAGTVSVPEVEGAAADAPTGFHALQLLFSFDSLMAPGGPASLFALSAHTRK